jgi:hypothetical protein
MEKKLCLLLIVLSLFACQKKDPVSPDPTPPPPPPPTPVTPIDPNAISIPVSGTQMGACFAVTTKKDVHPRLIFNAADITAIKNNSAGDPFAKPSYDDIMSRADAVIASPLLNYGLDAANLRITNMHTFGNDQAPYLILAYQFTKDTRYAARCWQQIERMLTWADWGANRHFLDAGIAAKAMALAFDGLYDYLTPAQRSALYNGMRTHVLNPGYNQITTSTGPFKWYDTDDNWNGICHGGMIMAALATMEMDSAFNSNLIAVCANGMLKYLQSFEPDGASEEGMSYWSYGLQNTFLALESMKRCLGATFGLTNLNGMKKTGMFPYMVSGPVGTASFGDDYLYVGKANLFLSYFWFSKFYNDANMARTHYERCMARNAGKTVKMNGWFDLIFYDRTLVQQGSVGSMPNAGYVRTVEYAYLAENTSDESALYAGIHTGKNDASHGHLDAGTFFIQAFGETWAQGNLGLESPYPSDFFTVTAPFYNDAPSPAANNRGRFYYYRVRTEGKNCLVFNPDARPEQNPSGQATVGREANDGNGGYFVVNMNAPYQRDVNAYKRGIKLHRNTKRITIQDEFTPKTSSSVYWIMHSPCTDNAALSADRRTITLFKNGKTAYMRIVSPANAQFSVVNRSTSAINYLEETAPMFSAIMAGKNGINQWYGKVQIKLTGLPAGTPTTLRVDFSGSATDDTTPVVALDSWTTTN